ncbi:hypothetical protein DMP38_26405, partial [Klebsiella pneumoniae]
MGIHSRTILALSLTPGGDALGLSAVSGRLAADSRKALPVYTPDASAVLPRGEGPRGSSSRRPHH